MYLYIDLFNMNLIGIEIPGWYDWIAYYLDEKTWQRYARDEKTPIWKDEVCRYNKIYRVKFYDKWWIKYKILSFRDLSWHTN